MGTTRSAAETARLREICASDTATPDQKLRAAKGLLGIAASERNIPIVRKVIAAFEFDADSAISSRAQKLKIRLEREIDEAKEALAAKRAEVATPVIATPITPASPSIEGSIGGIDLLPPDGEDETGWDRLGQGNTRRQRFCMEWNLPTVLTRAQIALAIAADPAKVRSHTVELKLWSRTREQLDKKFMEDQEEIRKLLAQHGFADAISGLNDLSKFVESKREPLVEFRPGSDPDGLPQLVRSKSGLLLDKIDFVAKWPQKRNQNYSL